ncbi:MAG: ATP-binding protein [Bacteroidales bacterium]
MKRQIITIDEEKCDGCGLCIPNCHEGALQIIDGKARLISDLFCDGLGACIGHCPQEAITLEEREAEPYNEKLVMEKIVTQGRNTILAHLQHLKEHNETGFLNEAIEYIRENNIDLTPEEKPHPHHHGLESGVGCGCAGSAPKDFRIVLDDEPIKETEEAMGDAPSELRQWPVQLHLLNPMASYLKDSDLLLASDCSAFTMGSFHKNFIKGKSLAIACPKLDQGKEIYIQKLATMIRDANLKSVTVVMMEVPCCGGLGQLVNVAMQQAGKRIPVRNVIMSIRGDIIREN